MTWHLALYTFGIFRKPAIHPDNDGFHQRNDAIFALAEGAPGFIARSGYADEPGPESWGDQVYPRFYSEQGDGWSPSTLSLWADLESAMAFSYSGLHAEALALANTWFERPQWPPYVLWWTSAQQIPQWSEAVVRHEHLHDNGPGPFAFNFKMPFDAAGRQATIDRQRFKAHARPHAGA